MTDNPFQTEVQFVRRCGPVRAELLARLNIHTVGDLLWYLPKDVLDLTELATPDKFTENIAVRVRGRVIDRDARSLSNNRTLTKILFDCDTDRVTGTWFNQPWMLQKFQADDVVLLTGKPKRSQGRWEISHPQVQWLRQDEDGEVGEIATRYGLTDGLRLDTLRMIMRAAVEDFAHLVPEHLPAKFLEEHKLPTLAEAIRGLHLPASMEEYERSRHRVLFDDLFEFQLALALRRRSWKLDQAAPALPCTAKIDARIRRLFPFRFTKGQDTAVQEISADLASGRAMHRLLQADVGAGKTAVALHAMLTAVAGGWQAVLMAPTEVLAQQHWSTVETALARSRVQRVLLTGHLTAAQRRKALEYLADGTTNLVIGTQAVIQDAVRFHKLGLAVIDEQHKFGVRQRSRFAQSDGLAPHVLVMTATPIPRSLCLTQFGDLDVTKIDELPPGRQRVVTSRVVGRKARARAWAFVRKQLQSGRQAYIVCPRVAGTDPAEDPQPSLFPAAAPVPSTNPATITELPAGDEAALSDSAEDVYRQLQQYQLNGFRVGLVHGQLDRQAKAEVMEAFRDGELDAIVATTVIEVGVDVANATLMVINRAESFGLSQLHQLRGRIGRGHHQGYCLLFSETDKAEAGQRLQALESTSDGFKIAEVDFELRGPGDVLGVRQHGELPLRIADLKRDVKILHEARDIAFSLVNSGRLDAPEFAPTKIQVLDRFADLMELPQTG